MIKKYPYYFRNTIVLIGLTVLVYIFSVLTEIMIPLAYALLLAILLNPVVNKFEQWKFPKIVAITAAIILAIVIIVAINYLIVNQIAGFSNQLPEFKKKFAELATKLQGTAKSTFGISRAKQNEYINEAGEKLKPLIGSAAGGLMSIIGMVVLLPVYTFLFLYYKKLLLNFLYELFSEENEKELSMILTQTKSAVQSYMVGLVLEAFVVAILNTTALFILGVDYAILLGVLGALLNVLPFIGGIIAIALPVLIATITKDGYKTQLLIVAAYTVIQLIDNHFLVPYLVASKVKINALI